MPGSIYNLELAQAPTLHSFCSMAPDMLLVFLDLPRDVGPLLVADRFSNFLFLNWAPAHADFALTVDLRKAKRYEDYTNGQQRILLSLLQRAATIKIEHSWAAQAWQWRASLNFHRYTSWRGEGCLRRGRCRIEALWYFTAAPTSSPLHMRLTMQGVTRVCFVLAAHQHEGAIVEAVFGTRRPRDFLLELTLLFAGEGACLAEAFFLGRLVRQWYITDAPVAEQQQVAVTFDRTCATVTVDGYRVLHFDSAWAVDLGHSWQEARLPAEPYFSAAFVLASSAGQVTLAAMPTDVRTGLAVES